MSCPEKINGALEDWHYTLEEEMTLTTRKTMMVSKTGDPRATRPKNQTPTYRTSLIALE